jgi:glycosyltransferase involved in cell wall biosynthesis
VLDRGYPHLEYIVMDGRSTDGSVEILEGYDEHLAFWVSEPDEDQSWAINRALERATGDVVANINSEDRYLPAAFDAALPLFSEPAARWVAGAAEYRHADGELEQRWPPAPPRTAWSVDQGYLVRPTGLVVRAPGRVRGARAGPRSDARREG